MVECTAQTCENVYVHILFVTKTISRLAITFEVKKIVKDNYHSWPKQIENRKSVKKLF